MRHPSKVVGIAGRSVTCEFTSAGQGAVTPTVVSHPEFLRPVGPASADGDACRFSFDATATGRGELVFDFAGERVKVPAVVFGEQEFFLCMAISSNYHYGWDPLAYLFGGGPERLELEGDAYRKTRQLERLYHMRGIPITWFIDKHVAGHAGDEILGWHYEFGDDYAVMPTSFFNDTELNYNTLRTPAETTEFVRAEMEGVERVFPFDTRCLAIDQWVGSVGSNFVNAAYELGVEAIWGIGYDHTTCDTSMFHRGCPWDVYKPSRRNFRIPSAEPSNLWVHQWTTRDIINTIHTPDGGPGGSVMFSTDPDDIRTTRIMFNQSDYWTRLLRDYRSNMGSNEYFVFLLHQEDHDCHFGEDADYIRGFLDTVLGEVTLATMDEITQWLNLKYPASEHPSQALLIHDPLTCHDKTQFYAGVQVPADWPAEGEQYPPHLACYGPDSQWVIQQGSRTPLRWYDYRTQTEVAETSFYPPSRIPSVEVKSEEFVSAGGRLIYRAEISADADASGLPFAIWEVPACALDALKAGMPAGGVKLIGDHLALTLDVKQGSQVYEVALLAE